MAEAGGMDDPDYAETGWDSLCAVEAHDSFPISDVHWGLRRLSNEVKDINVDPPETCSAGPIVGDLRQWQGIIIGPPDTPYSGGIFRVYLQFPLQYPFVAPKVVFKSLILHPNVNPYGRICLDVLKDMWTPALTVPKVLLSISALMSCPNFDSPLHQEAADLYKRDPEEYEATVRNWTSAFARGEPSDPEPDSEDPADWQPTISDVADFADAESSRGPDDEEVKNADGDPSEAMDADAPEEAYEGMMLGADPVPEPVVADGAASSDGSNGSNPEDDLRNELYSQSHLREYVRLVTGADDEAPEP